MSSNEKYESWVPRTKLGRMVLEGQISSIEELFMEGYKIRESEIVNVLLPDLQEEVINIGLVQKQSDAGEKSQFRAIVVVGNRDGYVGLGSGKAKQVRSSTLHLSVEDAEAGSADAENSILCPSKFKEDAAGLKLFLFRVQEA
jgi:small subunit ribosomal protein S5